ncbi:MAG: hypothetical protein ABIA63_08480 [bacterium]
MSLTKESINPGTQNQPKININVTRDRRVADRGKKKIKVRFGTQVLDKSGHTINISQSGVLISTRYIPEPKSHVNICLEWPDREELKSGVVIWAKMYERTLIKKLPVYFAGIKFI